MKYLSDFFEPGIRDRTSSYVQNEFKLLMAKGKIQVKLQVNKYIIQRAHLALAKYKNNACCETNVYGHGQQTC